MNIPDFMISITVDQFVSFIGAFWEQVVNNFGVV